MSVPPCTSWNTSAPGSVASSPMTPSNGPPPAIDEAITLEVRHNTRTAKHAMFIPTVHADDCTGCGKCEKLCVLDGEAAIKVLPRSLAQAGGSGHYRLGWKERDRTGHSLVPDALELPVRRPAP